MVPVDHILYILDCDTSSAYWGTSEAQATVFSSLWALGFMRTLEGIEEMFTSSVPSEVEKSDGMGYQSCFFFLLLSRKGGEISFVFFYGLCSVALHFILISLHVVSQLERRFMDVSSWNTQCICLWT